MHSAARLRLGSLLPRGTRGAAHLGIALSGVSALAYEVIWTRQLTVVFGSTVYAVSIMLAAFMSGLAIGGRIGGRMADRVEDPLRRFAWLEIGIGAIGGASLLLVEVLPGVYFSAWKLLHPTLGTFMLMQALLSLLVLLPPTIMMGAVFPIASRLSTSHTETVGTEVGSVYALNNLGAIIGAVATGFILIPVIGVRAATTVAAGLNLANGALLLHFAPTWRSRRAWTIPVLLFMMVILWLLAAGRQAPAVGFYNVASFSSHQDLLRYRSDVATIYEDDAPFATVRVLETPEGNRMLEHAGALEGSTFDEDRLTMVLQALLPIFSANSPSSVLIVGLGTGQTAVAALESPVDRVVTVEINRAMEEAARFFTGTAIDDQRHELIVADARHFLAYTDERFDVITSQPGYPLSEAASRLFTVEYFELARDRLNDDGVMCVWLPCYLLQREDYMMMYKTFHRVFPANMAWGRDREDYRANDVVLLGFKSGRLPYPELVERAVRESAGFDSYERVDFSLFETPETVAEAVERDDIPVHSDDRPLLEFRTARNWITMVWELTGGETE